MWSNPKALSVSTLLRLLAEKPVQWIFDWDGTLVDLADHPRAIRVPASLIRDLGTIQEHSSYPLVILSGRSLADLEEFIPLSDITLIGNHGAQWRVGGAKTVIPPDPQAQASLKALTEPLNGLRDRFRKSSWEDKQFTISFHMRQVDRRQWKELGEQLARLVEDHTHLQLRPADACWEIRPKYGATKGDAVQMLFRDHPNSVRPVVFGDDWTDEDAFEAANQDGITVIIGSRRPTRARYHVATPADLREILSQVARFLLSGQGRL